MHDTNTFVTCYKSLVKFKASKPKFTAEKKPCILLLDCLSDEYFVILYYFKTEKCKYNFFSNNQLLSYNVEYNV